MNIKEIFVRPRPAFANGTVVMVTRGDEVFPAVVLHSYADLFGGKDVNIYGVLARNEKGLKPYYTAWVQAKNMMLVPHKDGAQEIKQWNKDYKDGWKTS